jgi:hypothetical protein
LEGLIAFLKPYAYKPQVVRVPRTGRPFVMIGPDREGRGFRPVLLGMLLIELLGPGELRVCKNPRCGSIFSARRPNRIYCQDACQERYKAARQYASKKTRASLAQDRRRQKEIPSKP